MAEEKKDQEENKAAPSGKNPLLVILVAVNTVAVLGIGFFQFQNHKKLNSMPTMADIMKQQAAGEHSGGEAAGGEHGAPAKEGAKAGGHEEAKLDGILYPLDPFTANLSQGSGPQRFIRIGLTLKFSKESKKEEIDARKPQINDTIISMLNSKKPEELLKKEGKDFLREELKSSINNFLVDGQVIDIFFVNFQIN